MMNLIGSTSERSRSFNERVVLQLIRQYPEISRQEIASFTKLSAQTISVITASLIDKGFIISSGKVEGRRGQPQKKLVLNGAGAYGVGINIDRDFISVALINFGGEPIFQREERVSFPQEKHAKAIVCEFLSEAADFLGQNWDKVRGIGVSRPDYMEEWIEQLGINSKQRNVSVGLEYWSNDAFEVWLGHKFDLPVLRENDARAAAMCELFFSTPPLEHVFYLYISTAVGGCIVEKGECLEGASGAAGQFGLLYTKTGKYGERVLEALSLTSLQRYLVSNCNTTFDKLNMLKDTNLIHEWATNVVEDSRHAFTALLALINPSEIRVGGRIPTWMIEPFASALFTMLESEVVLNTPRVVPANYTNYSGASGAAVLPLYEMFAPQTSILTLEQ
ncbi:ROK family transcriptional regulator [Marinomonas mediterranea]|jgi:Transcriptional regulator/sugar kinase|uniref:Regulatory protein MarR n=1 Tax=Marinomonas mediterranea (strain ATCC 700492 / JCM 21426 / NBRC 103028 / MMB-1) TaxID=717774 RepID=F2JVT5_MARM1|nr:ROK family transcriptional regulator [Marinomonas mediterranea]ADZ91721.1 regulatory protein MarR [Marinomonas mediterranea MMB-1]WCN17817.1 ROK family protein [Marinomonas mediterranea MMB-1]